MLVHSHSTHPCNIAVLTLLLQVINKLTEGSSHVPYRESKLTLLLRESLGGNSRTGRGTSWIAGCIGVTARPLTCQYCWFPRAE